MSQLSERNSIGPGFRVDRFDPALIVERRLGIAALLLLAFVYTSHLGFTPIDIESDEPIRALVALEMMLSGDYITPTLNGELYLIKPPLYNWIIAASFHLFGNHSSFALRFPMLLSIFLFGFLVFFFVRRYINERVAWLSALALITNGRILIYDSLLGLIDIFYASVTFLLFMVTYEFGGRKKYVWLFILTWLLTSIGYLLKGYSSLVFQGCTLLAYFIYTRNFRKLFHWSQFLAFGIFCCVIGAYYLAYFNRNEIAPATLFSDLFTGNTKSTAINKKFGAILLHLFTYPFELFYHYAPWMALAITLFRKDVWRIIRSHPFIHFCVIIFLANFWIYWSSPNVFPRYIFMLLALLFTVLAYFYLERTAENDWRKKVVNGIFLFVTGAVGLGCLVLPFVPETSRMPGAIWKSVVLVAGFAWLFRQMLRNKSSIPFYFVLALALFRMGFNWFVIEQRGKRFVESDRQGREMAAITKGSPIYIWGRNFHHQHSVIGSKNGISYNISVYKGEIVRFKEERDTSSFFLVNKGDVDSLPHRRYYAFQNFASPDSTLLVRFTSVDR